MVPEDQVFIVGDDGGDDDLLLLEFIDGLLIEPFRDDIGEGGDFDSFAECFVMVVFLEVRAEILPGALDFQLRQEAGFGRDDDHVALVEEREGPAFAVYVKDHYVLLEVVLPGKGCLDVDELPVGVPVGPGRRISVEVAFYLVHK